MGFGASRALGYARGSKMLSRVAPTPDAEESKVYAKRNSEPDDTYLWPEKPTFQCFFLHAPWLRSIGSS